MKTRPKRIKLSIIDSFTGIQLVTLDAPYDPVKCMKGQYRKWVSYQKKGSMRNLWKHLGILHGEPMLKITLTP